MTVATTLARLRQLAELFPHPDMPWETRPEFHPPLSPESISDLEGEWACSLPQDLRAFLGLCGGINAINIRNGYWIGVLDRSRGLPEAVTTDDGNTVVVPIAIDGGGNAFLLAPAYGRVWRRDHETGMVRPVAESFSTSLERIADDWEHHLRDDRNWVYLT
jgi:hypothetical protein